MSFHVHKLARTGDLPPSPGGGCVKLAPSQPLGDTGTLWLFSDRQLAILTLSGSGLDALHLASGANVTSK